MPPMLTLKLAPVPALAEPVLVHLRRSELVRPRAARIHRLATPRRLQLLAPRQHLRSQKTRTAMVRLRKRRYQRPLLSQASYASLLLPCTHSS